MGGRVKGGRGPKPQRRAAEGSKVNLELVHEGLKTILGEAAATVVLGEIFPRSPRSRRLRKRDLETLKRGLERFFGDKAGLTVYRQIVGAK